MYFYGYSQPHAFVNKHYNDICEKFLLITVLPKPEPDCKDSQNLLLKRLQNLTQFSQKDLNCFLKKLKSIREKNLRIHPFSSELAFHSHNWLIISFKDFCIVIRK